MGSITFTFSLLCSVDHTRSRKSLVPLPASSEGTPINKTKKSWFVSSDSVFKSHELQPGSANGILVRLAPFNNSICSSLEPCPVCKTKSKLIHIAYWHEKHTCCADCLHNLHDVVIFAQKLQEVTPCQNKLLTSS